MTAPGRDSVSRRVWMKTGVLGLVVLAGLTLFFALRKRVPRLWFPAPSRTTP